MNALCLLLAAAFAASPASPQERLDEAWRRVDVGDWAGARILVDETRALEPEWEEELLYLEAVTYQLDRKHELAMERFDQLLRTFPEGERAIDTRFRRALTLADDSAFEDARDALKDLRPYGRLPAEGRQKIALCEATWLLEQGKKSGVRKVDKELRKLEEGQLTWFEARARSALLHHAVEASKTLDFAVPEAKVAQRLEQRAAWVFGAEAQLNALVDTRETWFVLQGLSEMGSAYIDLANDLLATPVPPDYGEIQTYQYKNRLEDRALVQLIKARKYYDLGLEHATRLGWQGPEGGAIERVLESLDARIESLEM